MAIKNKLMVKINGVTETIDVPVNEPSSPLLYLVDPEERIGDIRCAFKALKTHLERKASLNPITVTSEGDPYPELEGDSTANGPILNSMYSQELLQLEMPVDSTFNIKVSVEGKTIETTVGGVLNQKTQVLALKGGDVNNVLNVGGIGVAFTMDVIFLDDTDAIVQQTNSAVPSNATKATVLICMYRPRIQALGNATKYHEADSRVELDVALSSGDLTYVQSYSYLVKHLSNLAYLSDKYTTKSSMDASIYSKHLSQSTHNTAGELLAPTTSINLADFNRLTISGGKGLIEIPRTALSGTDNDAPVPDSPLPRVVGEDTIYYINDILPYGFIFDLNRGKLTRPTDVTYVDQ